MRNRASAFLGFSCCLLVACSGDDGPTTTDTVTPGGVPTQGVWALSFSPVAEPAFVPSFSVPDGVRAETLVVRLDHLGLPWDAFSGPISEPNAPPAGWVGAVDAVIAGARASGRGFILVISPISERFDGIAADARDDGGALVIDDAFRTRCFDPAREARPEDLPARFGRYARWVTARARPDAVVIGHRVNLLEASCGGGVFSGMLRFIAEGVAAVRTLEGAEVPGTAEVFAVPPIVVGVDVEDLYGLPSIPGRCAGLESEACLAERWSAVDTLLGALPGTSAPDVVALESYPALWLARNPGASLPQGYLTSIVDRLAGVPSAILGTGLPAVSLSRPEGPCVAWITSDETEQARWVDLALTAARAAAMPWVIWRTAEDPASTAVASSCPCTGDVALCAHLAGAGAEREARRARLVEGLRDSDGEARAALGVWNTRFE